MLVSVFPEYVPKSDINCAFFVLFTAFSVLFKTFSEIVREYDLNESSLCRWLKIYRTEGLEGLAQISKGGRRKDTHYKKRGQEILEKKKYLSQQEEIRLLKMEKEYYKKMVELLTEENLKKKNQTINRKPK